jgi:peptidoglycan/LPS O-acetylase OafA/YrhL
MPKIDGLTSVRALAALWVVLFHFRYGARADEMPLAFVFKGGASGVALFFILSGFILGYTYHRTFTLPPAGLGAALRQYGLARVARVYPAHLAVLLAFPLLLIPLRLWPALPNDNLQSFLLSAFLLHGWGFTKTVVWNQASWSVSTEAFCYLLFPAVVLLVSRAPRVAAVPLFALATWGLYREQLNVWLYQAAPSLAADRPFVVMTLHYFSLFLFGYSLFLIFDLIGLRLWSAFSSLVIIGALLAALWIAALPPGHEFWLYVAMGALILALAAGSGPVYRIFGVGVLVYLGEISYSLYLTHEAAREITHGIVWRILAPGSPAQAAPLLLELTIALMIAAGCFHLVERPARSAIRAWGNRRRARIVAETLGSEATSGGSSCADLQRTARSTGSPASAMPVCCEGNADIAVKSEMDPLAASSARLLGNRPADMPKAPPDPAPLHPDNEKGQA